MLGAGEPRRVQAEVAGRAQHLARLARRRRRPAAPPARWPGRRRRRRRRRPARRQVPERRVGQVELPQRCRPPRGRRAGRRRRGRRRTTTRPSASSAKRHCPNTHCGPAMSHPRRRPARPRSCGRFRYSDQKFVAVAEPPQRQVRRPTSAGRPTRPGPPASTCSLPSAARTTSWAASHGMCGVVPLQPRQRDAVGGQPRVGDEVRAADQDLGARRRATRTISLTTSAAPPEAGWVSRTASTPSGGDAQVGVPHAGRHRRLRGHRHGGVAARVEPVQPLVGELGEPQRARPATVHAPPPYSCTRVRAFQGAGRTSVTVPSGERRTTTDRPPSSGRDSDHHTSAPSTHHLAEPGGRADHELGGDRGRPAAGGERRSSCL